MSSSRPTDSAVRRETLAGAPWIRTVEISSPRRAVAYAGLDPGEAEVLALAEEQDARLVVIDERKARRYAERMGFPLTGTLGVLLLAKEAGLIQTVGAIATQLKEAGLFLSPSLVRRTLEIAGEDS